MSWRLDGRPLRRMLITRLRYLGDVIMSTVLLDVLRHGDPHLEIDYLCEEPYAPVLVRHQGISRLHILRTSRRSADSRSRTVVAGDRESQGQGTWRTVLNLRRRRYDLAVDLYFNPRSSLLLWAAGITARVCGARRTRSRLFTHVAEFPEGSAADRLAGMAPGVLGHHLSRLAPLTWGPHDTPFLQWLQDSGLRFPLRPHLPTPVHGGNPLLAFPEKDRLQPAEPYLVLAPGATWPAKSWPVSHWRTLADGLARAGRTTLVLSPPEGDKQLSAALSGSDAFVLAPQSLAGVLSVLAGAAVVIAVDGGVMHAAIGLARPTVGLFGPTATDLWFPYTDSGPFRVMATHPPCSPCDLHECEQWICMPELLPERVLSTCEELYRQEIDS